MTAAALTPPQSLRRSSLTEEDEEQQQQQPQHNLQQQPLATSFPSLNSQNRRQRPTHAQHPSRQIPKGVGSNILFQWMETCAVNLFSTCENGGQVSWTSAVRNEPLHALDYSQLHDHFLESLLQEAAKPTENKKKEKSNLGAIAGLGNIPDDSDSSVFSSSSNYRKRRLPRLNRKSSSHNSSSSNKNSNSNKSSNTTASGNDSANAALPLGQPFDPSAPLPLLPSHFLHEHARMQKDKGRGEEPGSLICVKGQEACMDKLRAKMQLLCNTAIQEKGASMKRRPARVSIHLDNFVETRSILEVRLGFLSMMYGILLRWDTNVTGKITLVVLRKMCHESFYPHPMVVARTAPLNVSTSGSSNEEEDGDNDSLVGPLTLSKERSSPRVIEGKAIVDWPDGTEVTILEPPYLIPRPDKFKPTVMAIPSLYATGLDKKSNWLVQFILNTQVVSLNLVFDPAAKRFIPKPTPSPHSTSSVSNWNGISYELESFDAMLDVRLYQVRSRRKKLIGSMEVPLSNLPVQKDPPTHLSIPCQEATLDLDIYLESESLEWTQNELEARRKASNFFWPSQRGNVPLSPPHPGALPPQMMIVDTDEDYDEDDDDAWGWILCHMC